MHFGANRRPGGSRHFAHREGGFPGEFPRIRQLRTGGKCVTMLEGQMAAMDGLDAAGGRPVMEGAMAKAIKYYIVAAEALPEIFVKVAEAKRMMQTGEADTVGAATKLAGISRSAFYKYKDSVQPFNDMKAEHIITFYAMLKDVAGVLSGVLAVFAASGANILTINQSIPTNGCAAVTISAETSGLSESLEQLMGDVTALEGVLKFEILAG